MGHTSFKTNANIPWYFLSNAVLWSSKQTTGMTLKFSLPNWDPFMLQIATEKILSFEWSPPWQIFDIASDISTGNIYIWHNLLTVYSGILSGVLSYLTFYSGILSGVYSDILSVILCGIYTDIFSGILSGIFSAICSGIRSAWHLFWHSFLAFYVVEVGQGTLWSGACGGGLARNTLILSLRWRPGGEHSGPELAKHSDPELAGWRSGGEHSDPELAVEVRRETLWSWAYGGGPAGNTLILSLNTLIRSLQWRSGEEHSDPELAVQVRRGTLWSGACGGGPAGNTLILSLRGGGPVGNTLILSLRWGSGGEHSDPELEHSDPELAVEVRRGTLWSGAFGGGPAGNTLIRSLRWRSGGEHSALILSLQLRSGEEHSDPELAVEVRRGTLWSWACGGGVAGNTLILSLRWRSGGEHSDPELSVEVRRGTLWSWACSWGPARSGGRRRRASWHKIKPPSPDRWGNILELNKLLSANPSGNEKELVLYESWWTHLGIPNQVSVSTVSQFHSLIWPYLTVSPKFMCWTSAFDHPRKK